MANPELQTSRIIGQDHVVRFLQTTIERKRIATAYLFSGPNAVGKRTTAQAFLQAVLCSGDRFPACGSCASCTLWAKKTHPDAVFLNLSGTSPVGIDDIRSLQKQLSYRSAQGGYRVALIGNMDECSIEAANALLKTLEEPPEKVVLVLCATSLGSLPLTLRSRCQHIGFSLVPRGALYDLLREKTENMDLAKNLSHVAIGRPGLALNLLLHPDEFLAYQERVRELLDVLQQPLAMRLQRVRSLLPAKLAGKEARSELTVVIDLWIWLLRDAALIQQRQDDLLVHPFLWNELEQISSRLTTAELVAQVQHLDRMKQLLRESNANPQLVIEHCLIQL